MPQSKTKKVEFTFLGIITVVTVVAVVIPLLFLVDPSLRRDERIDQATVQNMMIISDAIQVSLKKNGELPVSIDSLVSDKIRNDVRTDAPITYSIRSSRKYSLCAVFRQKSEMLKDYWPTIESTKPINTMHAQGYDCIDFAVGDIN